jgi:hypothetical protein
MVLFVGIDFVRRRKDQRLERLRAQDEEPKA